MTRWMAGLGMSLLLLGGCSSDSGPQRSVVSGTVTFDKAPVENGQITFTPTGSTKGPAAYGKIINGKYEFEPERGPVVGEHLVSITWSPPNGEKDEEGRDKFTQVIPARYNDQTTLKQIVKGGKETFDFPLEKEAAP